MAPNLLPSARLVGLFAAASSLFLVSPAAAWTVDVILLFAAALDGVRAPGRAALRVTRRTPARVGLGERFEARLSLAVAGRRSRATRVRVTDDLPASLARAADDVMEIAVPPRRAASAGYTVRAERRGDHRIGDVHVRVLGPLGLVWRQHRIGREDAIRVQPGLAAMRRRRRFGVSAPFDRTGGRDTRRPTGSGSFESLREYVRGDDPRRIEWKASARRGTLVVRRHAAERSQNVVLAVDAGRLMRERIGDRARLDHALAAALLLADVASRHQDRVGLLVFADRIQRFLPARRVDLPRLADALATVEARPVEPNYPAAFDHLGRQLRRRSLVVVFTDLIDAHASHAVVGHLVHAASRHLALAVTLRNPALEAAAVAQVTDEEDAYRRAAAEELVQARARALATMRRAGVLVADTAPDRAIDAVVERYLEIKGRALL